MSRTPTTPMPADYDPLPPMWQPWPFRTTYVGQAFPEHHYPLEGAVHRIGKGMTQFGHAVHNTWDRTPDIHTPKADIQETANFYYVDVELPGVEDSRKISLEWISSRMLHLEVKVARSRVDEEDDQPSQPADAAAATGDHKKKRIVCTTLKERRLGTTARAFHFPTAVDHGGMTAHLAYGILRLKIPKILDEPVKAEHKTVVVQDGPAAGS